MIEERRIYQRKTVSLYTDIFDFKMQNTLGECLVTDVCKNGFAIESETDLSVGQKIVLKFDLQDKSVLLTGEIVRMGAGFFYPLYGIKLCEFDCINLSFFKQYIDYSLN